MNIAEVIKTHIFNGFTPVFLFLIFLVSRDMHLSADGVELMRLTVENEWFFLVSEARENATYLTQWVIVLAMALGVKELNLLVHSYGLSVIILFLVPYILIQSEPKAQRNTLTWIYGLMICGVTLPSMYLLGAEHQVLVPLSFSLAYVLVKSMRDPGLLWVSILLVLIYLTCLTYETNVILLGISFAYTVYALIKGNNLTTLQRIMFCCCLLVCLYGMYESLNSIANPRDPANKAGFINDLIKMTKNPAFLVWIISVIIILVSYIRRELLVVVAVFGAVLVYALSGAEYYQDVARVSFASRTLTIVIPGLGMLVILGLMTWRNDTAPEHPTTYERRSHWYALSLVLIAAFRLYLPFEDFHRDFLVVVNNEEGIVDAQTHQLGAHPASWMWTFPSMSVAWQKPCVNAILMNPNPNRWEPYKPKEYLPYSSNVEYTKKWTQHPSSPALCLY